MTMRKATVASVVVIVIMGLIASALSAVVATRTISNSAGRTRALVVGVGVYSDNACATALSTISWGNMNPSYAKTYAMYVRNEGNVPVTLNMAVRNWNPASASRYITLTWNKKNYVLPAGQVVQAVLTLTVSSSVKGVTSFRFDLTITGTQ